MHREYHAHKGLDLRSGDDGVEIIDGYASVTEFWYDVAGGPERGGWREMITRGAFEKTIAEQLDAMFLLADHDGLPVAGTRNRTLLLEEDARGLRIEATPNMASAYNREIVLRVADGLFDSMSFAFSVPRDKQEWNSDYTERRIHEVRVFEVSVVKWPANPATVAQMRADMLRSVAELRSGARPAPTGMDLDLARAIATSSRAAA